GDIAVFARSEDVDMDMGRFMREALRPMNGRGGGRPNFAQGGAPGEIDIASVAALAAGGGR
ncbi:DHHA1 domain-containing protein, partial [Acinetobacter sp. 163]|nr:DHHA1 domain-containing protein [Acinetobacter sp. 163]